LYKNIIRPLLFSLSAEKAHNFTFSLLQFFMQVPGLATLLRRWYTVQHPSLERHLWGLRFPNPVGLAAGFDKDARLVRGWQSFGFGFVEIGTLTPKGQPGNPQPRLFRLPADAALINRMGFNNGGVQAAVQRLQKRPKGLIVGGNIGKNKSTPNEQAVQDYLKCFEALFNVVDYFVVNVSSPNTPNLRDLQEKAPLKALLTAVQQANHAKPKPKPLLLKIAPDLTNGQLDDIVEIVQETKLDGLIATNTTISRQGLQTPQPQVQAMGAGGLSGRPLTQRSTEVIQYLHQQLGPKVPIVAVGGIFTAAQVQEKLAAGASLVQMYTGFIYEGPGAIKRINKALIKQQQAAA